MADSDGSAQRADRHHRRSRSRCPVSPEWTGENPCGARGAEAGGGGGAGRGAGWAAPGGLCRHRSVDPGDSVSRGDRPRRPSSKPCRPTPGGGPSEPRRGPDRGPGHATDTGGSPSAGTGRIAEGCRSRRGERGGRARGCNRGHATKAGEGPRTGHGRLAGGRRSSSSGQGGREVPRPRQPHPHPHQAPQAVPPQALPPGADAARPPPDARALAAGRHAAAAAKAAGRPARVQEGGDGAQAELRASHGSTERGTGGDRGSAQEHTQRAGQGTRGREQGRSSRGGQSAGSGWRDSGQGAGKGPGHGKGAQGRGQGAQVQGAERGTVGERAGQGVGDRGRDPRHGQRAGRGPEGKGKGATGPKGQAGRGMGARGGRRVEGRGTGGGAPPQLDVQPVRCIPPGIQQIPAHHTHHHHHQHHHLYNIDPDAGELIPPQPPRPRHQPAPPGPRAEPARMASAGGGAGRGTGAAGTGAAGGAGARGSTYDFVGHSAAKTAYTPQHWI